MKAKQLFTNDHPESARHVKYMSALIIMQNRVYAYYSILVMCDVIWTRRTSTAGTDGCYIYVNPDFFFGLETDEQRAFLLAHEVGHIVLRHAARGEFYKARGFHSMRKAMKVAWNHRTFNEAADYVINADLIKHGLHMIDGGLIDSRFTRDDLVDTVYLTLFDEQPEQPEEPEQPKGGYPAPEDEQEPEEGEGSGGEGEGEGDDSDESEGGEETWEGWGEPEGESESGEGDDGTGGQVERETDGSGEGEGEGEGSGDPQPSDHGGHDDHYSPEYDGTPEEQDKAAKADKAEMERKIDTALDLMDDAKDRGERHVSPSGSFAGAGYRHGGEGEVSSVDWHTELADVVTRVGSEGEITWGRIQRRKFATIGVVMPARLGTMDRIAVTVDISGSVCQLMLHQFILELAALIDLMQPTSGCLIMWTNEEVTYTDEVSSGSELLDLTIPSGGGTRMAAGAEYLEVNGLNADVHLCFTDGDLWDDADWQACADAGVIMVLDRHPSSWVMRPMLACGIRYIVASDEALAA